MVVVADASVAIRGDLSGFDADLRRAEGGVKASAGRMDLTFQNILKAGALFGIGTSLPQLFQRAIGLAGDAAAAFSELQQTQRTTDEVFGESAVIIEDWAKRAADAAGMSQRTVFQSASVMGQTLRNMGFDADEAAEKVVQLQQRASEMAIAFGTTPERAILAITAAMRGERDTIEKFGVSIKQVDVNSRIAALGLDVSTSAARKNSEAMVILDLVLQQTAGQADRFAESQDDVAVQMAVAQAKIDNGMVTFGQSVASIQLGAVRVAGFTGEELDKFAMHFGDNFQTIKRLADEAGVTWDVMQQRAVLAMEERGRTFDQFVEDQEIGSTRATAHLAEGLNAAQRTIAEAGPAIRAEARIVASMLPEELAAKIEEIRAAGRASAINYAAGLLDAQNDPLAAIEAITLAQETELTRAEEIARLEGQLAMIQYAAGQNDEREGVQAAIEAAMLIVTDRMTQIGYDAFGWGGAAGAEFARGLESAQPAVRRAANSIGAPLRGMVGIQSEPSDPHSPLRGITTWGGNIVKTIAEGIVGNLGTGSAAASALAGALSPSLAMSGVGSPGIAAGAALTLAGGGGPTFVLNVNGVQYKVSSAEEAIETLQGLGVFHEGRL